jgi:SNF2 family DNA or RNA helicase
MLIETKDLTLYPSQQICVDKIAALDECALFADTGTGKTAMAISWLAWKLRQHERFAAILWVAPISVHNDIQIAVRKWLPKVDAIRVYRGRPEKPSVMPYTLYIVNYEWLLRQDLFSGVFDIVIFDESHRLKGRKSTTKAALKIAKEASHRLIMTGTPWTNNICDVWGQLQVMFAGDWSYKRYMAFENMFALKGGYMGHSIIGSQNESLLLQEMDLFSARLKLSDVVDMPPEHEENVNLVMTPEEKTEYEKVKGSEFPNALAKFSALHRKGAMLKIPYTVELVKDMQEPCLVIASYTAEGRVLAEQLGCHYIEGSTAPLARTELLNQNKTIVCQISTISEGVTLTDYHYMVFNSCNFRWGDYVQVKARIFRVGQKHPVVYTRVQLNKTADMAVWKCMDRKTDVISVLNGGGVTEDMTDVAE